MSWSRVRSDSVVGIVGTISASAASKTLSLVRVIPGAQSSEGDVVPIDEWLEERGEASCGVFGSAEFEIEMAQGEVGGHDVDGRVVGGVNARRE